MECQKPFIDTNEEDIELASKRVTEYDVSPEYQPETTINTTTAKIDISTTETTMLTMLTNSYTTTKNVSKLNKWKQNGITVAGGNGQGQQLNQMYGRIVEWKYNATEGQIITSGNRMYPLNRPTDVIVDQQNHSIIIADHENRRVIQWLNQTQQILIKNIGCYGLAMDKNGFLYVSDWYKNEVTRWKMDEYNNEGIVVAGGNGYGNQLSQLDRPTYIFVDEDESVYVSDSSNHRVMKWRKDAKEGRIVAGGNGQGKNLNQLSNPQGVIVDHFGYIYVADCNNHRIMRWCDGKEEGEVIVDGKGHKNQLYSPTGLSFDDEGNLYVADVVNDRVEKFEIIL
ncbi:unnamed protein product [Adineta steineri]|uniref:Uncharacterized protein n=1 Tax=Adineta steineri TaxID=433720 RepID=A0A815JGI9_9BILA|nr:unnamed protein product [Adineta steineri]CAF1387324.1 unnamed protein product [Adineta steineri]CAF1607849.1 unnamed protein product [Adineta steineri]CAF1609941.1 unnamed protein product [Adineta steineri]